MKIYKKKQAVKIITYILLVVFYLAINSCRQPEKETEKYCVLEPEELELDYPTYGYTDFTISNVMEYKKDENNVFGETQTNDSYRFVRQELNAKENLLVYKNGVLFKKIINLLGITHLYTPVNEELCILDNAKQTILISYYVKPKYTPQIEVNDTLDVSIAYKLFISDSVNRYKMAVEKAKQNPILIVTRIGIKGLYYVDFFINENIKIKGYSQNK